MSRPKDTRKKVDVARATPPLQQNVFAALDGLDALKDLSAPEPPHAPEPEPDRPPAEETPRSAHVKPPKPVYAKNSRGRLILRRETKDRGGKIVVVVYGFNELPGANAVMIGNLAKELKGKLGCGGSFDRQEIVLQGDRAAAVCALLEELGFRV
ncbi:MAG TPA: translation initiation factor, partial [Candidatus Methylacidiphilales bacterium]|nr:translation initiation factor [Candidatus Methylacidiphilales bacterium]